MNINELQKKWNGCCEIQNRSTQNCASIEFLKDLLETDWKEQLSKLTVKYGRGLLLFGPPGTGE